MIFYKKNKITHIKGKVTKALWEIDPSYEVGDVNPHIDDYLLVKHVVYPSKNWLKRLISLSDSRRVCKISMCLGGSIAPFYNVVPYYYIENDTEAEKEIIHLVTELQKKLEYEVHVSL
jgi:hypothetical protein